MFSVARYYKVQARNPTCCDSPTSIANSPIGTVQVPVPYRTVPVPYRTARYCKVVRDVPYRYNMKIAARPKKTITSIKTASKGLNSQKQEIKKEISYKEGI